jgi:hypothetical protein
MAIEGAGPADPNVVADVEARANTARLQEQPRPPLDVNRVRSDMRAMTVALETYSIDFNDYPPSVNAGDPRSINRGDPLMSQMPSFAEPALTTPIAYITGLFQDPSATSWATFAYERFAPSDPWHGLFGDWVLLSPGPDGDWDLTILTQRRRARQRPTVAGVVDNLFDPTNGLTSSGDIVRTASSDLVR